MNTWTRTDMLDQLQDAERQIAADLLEVQKTHAALEACTVQQELAGIKRLGTLALDLCNLVQLRAMLVQALKVTP